MRFAKRIKKLTSDGCGRFNLNCKKNPGDKKFRFKIILISLTLVSFVVVQFTA